jgi:hypothetical protein
MFNATNDAKGYMQIEINQLWIKCTNYTFPKINIITSLTPWPEVTKRCGCGCTLFDKIYEKIMPVNQVATRSLNPNAPVLTLIFKKKT